ncbi:hypothetical protein Cyast_0612 [Cyanobacterium stanieri PCC 7202]|uniref:Uncharacterized protein n=1 Tax=Cyanobacterium stanieri (strain ATCC 29140 / PCC 7202) TaxID=292563 RepID=K9YIA0_CYASC|nr:hypothetical protein Cyast_0612 [Cyanobacterium stanieri PCC 7202]
MTEKCVHELTYSLASQREAPHFVFDKRIGKQVWDESLPRYIAQTKKVMLTCI